MEQQLREGREVVVVLRGDSVRLRAAGSSAVRNALSYVENGIVGFGIFSLCSGSLYFVSWPLVPRPNDNRIESIVCQQTSPL